jgi:hypothetical protein
MIQLLPTIQPLRFLIETWDSNCLSWQKRSIARRESNMLKSSVNQGGLLAPYLLRLSYALTIPDSCEKTPRDNHLEAGV